MKILLIGFSKIKYMPYMNFYLGNKDFMKNDIHVLYWNRDGVSEPLPAENITYHEFKELQQDEVPKFTKIGNFLRFRLYAKKLMKQENFDFLVIFLAVPALLFYKTLTEEYRDRFFFDFRDVTYENSVLFKNAVSKVVLASKATFISSDGFRKYLPDSEQIRTTHNILKESLNHRREFEKSGAPLNVAFWGIIRHEELNKALCDRLGNDKRFELHYYGREQTTAENLKEHCRRMNYENVHFHGEYSAEDRYAFAETTDILHNIYENSTMKDAMSNKYYDGLLFRIPQICMPGSFLGKCAEGGGVGKAIDPYSSGFADDLFEYYNAINSEPFSENCDRELIEVLREYGEAEEMLKIN